MLKKALASVAFMAVAVVSVSACGVQDDGVEYVYVQQHGYYDSHHHWHSPKKVKVTRNYYNHHKSSYGKPYKTVKPKSHSGSSYNRTTPKKIGGGTYKKSGGYSYKRKR